MKKSLRKASLCLAFCMLITISAQALSYGDLSKISNALFFENVDSDNVGIEENSEQSYDLPDPDITEGTCGYKAYWSFNEENGVLTVSGSGEMENFPEKSYPHWYYLRSSIKAVEIAEEVTAIRGYAFADCPNLTKVILGEKVSQIDPSAFSECSALLEFQVHENNDYFFTDKGVLCSWETKGFGTAMTKTPTIAFCPKGFSGKYTIPDGISKISSSAFFGCDKLEEVIIPDSVSAIDYNAFSDCSGLKGIIIPDSVKTISSFAFSDCTSLEKITLPQNKVSISRYAFSKCTALKEITIPEGITGLADDVFYNCTRLTKVYLPDSLTTFNTEAFEGCPNVEYVLGDDHPTFYFDGNFICRKGENSIVGTLKKSTGKVVIPEGIEKIEAKAFMNSWNITEIIFPKSLTSLGEYSFYGCTLLKTLNLPSALTEIPPYAFYGCKSIEKIVIPSKVKSIGTLSFNDCISLKELDFEDGIEKIGADAFRDCSSLEKINFPATLKVIDGEAFFGCSSLKEVVLPSSIESFGYHCIGYELCECGLWTYTGTIFYVEKGSAAEDFCLTNFGEFETKYIDVFTVPTHKYYLDPEKRIAPNFPSGEKVSDFVSYSGSLGTAVSVTSADEILSTGDIISKDGTDYTVSVKGDVDGDGKICVTDYMRIKNHLIGRLGTDFILNGAYFVAADMDDDESISAVDYLTLKMKLMNVTELNSAS